MKKIQVILGNIVFEHFSEDELKLFKEGGERRSLIQELKKVVYFDTIEEAYEEVDNTNDSWIIPCEYTGEIVFEHSYDKYSDVITEEEYNTIRTD